MTSTTTLTTTLVACGHCVAAAERIHASFDNACRGCRARRVARSIEFHNAKTAAPEDHDFDRMRDRYRSLLVVASVSHQEVRAAAAVDFEQRAAAC